MKGPDIHIGVAGWSIPSALADRFEREGSHLQRYASRLDAVEINSSFYRPHRRSTYERWAASVPDGFRFAVKLPKTITHERRLAGCDDLLGRFADEVVGLARKRGPILLQLPPSLAFDESTARQFFVRARDLLGGVIACEPRHPSWFDGQVNALLVEQRVARVAADPPVAPSGGEPDGWLGTTYFRLHGAPLVYRSDYSPAVIKQRAELMQNLSAAGSAVWAIFDNTAEGHAPANALALVREHDHVRAG